MREDHPSLVWHCTECGIEQKDHSSLHTHMLRHHHPGLFACPAEQCRFEASTRQAVVSHCATTHQNFVCSVAGCDKAFSRKDSLKKHEATHREARPYRCKWPGCALDAKRLDRLVRHIRVVHFKLPETKKVQQERGIVDDRNPNDFIEVVEA